MGPRGPVSPAAKLDRPIEVEPPPAPPTRVRAGVEAHRAIGRHVYDFYRCDHCKKLVTQPQMVAGLRDPKRVDICPCGGMKFRPTNPVGVEWLLPRTIAFACTRIWELISGARATHEAGPDTPPTEPAA